MSHGARLLAAHLLGPRGRILASHHLTGEWEGDGVPLSQVVEGLQAFLRTVAPAGEDGTVMALDHAEGRLLLLRGRITTLVAVLDGHEDAAQRAALGDFLARFEERHGPGVAAGAADDAVRSAARAMLALLEPAIRLF